MICTSHINWWAVPDWWTVVATGSLVAVGIGQFVLFWWQLRLIHRSVGDAKEAAISAKEAAETARRGVEISAKAFEATNRPWLGIKEVDPLRVSVGVKPSPRFIIRNYGNGPALNVRASFMAGIDATIPTVPSTVTDEVTTYASMPKGDHWHYPFKDQAPLTQEQVNGIMQGNLKAWVVAKIEYFDAIGIERHFTTIRARFNPNINAWDACEEGNDAK